jgi:dipeptidyl aminopeptidase/acylaminoacyl peptidase
MMLKPMDLGKEAAWRQRFRAAAILWTALAEANPARGLVCTDRDGIYQLYAWDVANGQLTRLTDQPAGVVQGMISADGEWVYYLQDAQGNEIGHYVRVPFAGGTPEDVTPAMPPYASFMIRQSRSGRVTGFLTAGAEGFRIHVKENGQAARQIAQFKQLTFGPILCYDGEIAVVDTAEHSGNLNTSLIAIDTRSGEVIAELWDSPDASHSFTAFAPLAGDYRMLGSSSQSGYERPLVWNPRTGERIDLKIDDIPGDVTSWCWSADGQRVVLGQLHQAVYQLYLYDLTDHSARKLDHPSGVLGGYNGNAYFAPDGDVYVTWQDSVTPSCLIALDGQSGHLKREVLRAGHAPGGRKWRSFQFTTSNGTAIQGWLATPEGEGPFPTILETHGGPTAVMCEFFTPSSQAWLDHGFAFATINYHGSTTFGKDFEKAIWGKLGQQEVDDMAAAYAWLVENRIAQPDAVLVTGWSYGGYLTLQAMGKQPDLWAGGMAGIAIADWNLMYEDQAETLRGYQRALFGGTPDEKPEAHQASSPITYAEQVRSPILVIQGSNDTRCPPRQMRAYEARLRELGKPIQVHWFDAGHGSRAMEQSIRHQEMLLEFAYRVLDGIP